jgi:hypothetical protein
MFSNAYFCEIEIYVDNQLINVWEYLPINKFCLTKYELEKFLEFLSIMYRSKNINGAFSYNTNKGIVTYKICNATVID